MAARQERAQARQASQRQPVSRTTTERRWRGSVSGVRAAAIWLAFTRLRRVWRQLVFVGVGVTVAVMMVCLAPLYTAVIEDAQIQNALRTADPPHVNMQADATLSDMSASTTHTVSAELNGIAQRDIGRFIGSGWEYRGTTAFMRLQQIDHESILKADPSLSILSEITVTPFTFDYTAALPHMNILAGRLPHETARNTMPEVLVTPKLHVKPGQLLTLTVSGAPLAKVTARVVGVWFPKNVFDPFWNGYSFDTALPVGIGGPPVQTLFPVLFAPTTFQTALNFTANQLAGESFGVVIHDILFTNFQSISTNSIGSLEAGLAALRNDLNASLLGFLTVQSVGLSPGLASLLAGLQQQSALLALPLDIVAGQVVGLALLFIAMMISQLIEGQASEIATLKSRGASATQLVSVYLTQGTALAVLAFVAGPILAALLSVFLARTFIPLAHQLSPTYLAQAAAPSSVLEPAAIGALASLLTIVFVAAQATRFDVLAFRRAQGRGGGAPFWRRYYLDIFLVILCLFGYVEFGQFGGLNVREQLGQSSTGGPDPLLLLTPGLLLLAGALVALRLFPLMARWGAWFAARRRGAVGVLTFAQIARTPGRFGALTLLLTLGVGLGLFALTFQTSLSSNTTDRVAYTVGADERVTFQDFFQGEGLASILPSLFAHEPGVLSATPVYRGNGDIPGVDQSTTAVQTLAIDPYSFGQTASWRADYASQPLSSLLREMIAHEAKKPPQPIQQLEQSGAPSSVSIYTLVDQTFASVEHLRVGDRFVMQPSEGDESFSFVVGGIINDFPTMYDEAAGGYIVVDIHDYFAALANEGVNAPTPTEYWLRTTSSVSAAAQRARDYQGPNFFFVAYEMNRRALLAQMLADPLTSGMTSLLLVGAGAAAVLSALGSLTLVVIESRRRATSFAILRDRKSTCLNSSH